MAYAREWKWTKLNNKIGLAMSKLVFAEFNGNGTYDVAINNETDGKWYISDGGRGPWTVLDESPDGNRSNLPNQLHPYALESMLIGDFDGDHRADVLHYQRYLVDARQHHGPDGKSKKKIGYGLQFVMSKSGASTVSVRTEANMR